MNKVVELNAGTTAGSAGTDTDALTYLRSIYTDPMQPTSTRLRAAGLALNYERPRLQVTAQVSDQGVAELLDQRLKRLAEMEAMKLIDIKPATNGNGQPLQARLHEPPAEPQRAPLTRLYSNRFRVRGFLRRA
jgi:hypothetical protein